MDGYAVLTENSPLLKMWHKILIDDTYMISGGIASVLPVILVYRCFGATMHTASAPTCCISEWGDYCKIANSIGKLKGNKINKSFIFFKNQIMGEPKKKKSESWGNIWCAYNRWLIHYSLYNKYHIVYNTENRDYLLTFMREVLFRQLHICVFDTIKYDAFDLCHSTRLL